jgi:N-acyl-D-aspartate/D-glutamate deacylase
MFDLIVSNARIVDGRGGPPLDADLAVQAGRIAAIGHDLGDARETVDARGLALAPGIIDVHTHYDAQLTWDAACTPSPALGVTTVVIGNCGFTITPNKPDTRDLLLRNLSEVEGMSLTALRAGVDWRFESFPEYLDLLRDRGVVPNVAAFMGHSGLRTCVMGEDASRRAATDDEIEAMAQLLREGLDAGAIGFASSTFENHSGFGGLPMPSRLATDQEFERLVAELGKSEHGLFMATVGERTTVDTLAGYAAQTGRPAIYAALLHNDRIPERSRTVLARCRQAHQAGQPVYAQVSCQPLTMSFTLDSAYPLYGIAPWGALPIDDPDALKQAFAERTFRDAVRADLAAPAGGRLFNGDWERVVVADSPSRPDIKGRSVHDLATDAGVDPLDMFLDLALADGLETVFDAKLLNIVEDEVEDMLKHTDSLISLSDAGAHLTFFCDAGYGLYLLGHWVRERKSFSLEAAIRELTSRPAEIYGIPDRGVLAPGAWADMILFDPAAVGIGASERVFDLPAGESRMIRQPRGLAGVWVNGVQVHDGNAYLDHDRPPGQVLTDFAA